MNEPTDNARQHAWEAFTSNGGVLRTTDATRAGVQKRTLYWMRDHGFVEPLGRGVYYLVSDETVGNPDLGAVMRRYPKAVLSLVSALEYHGIGTQVPRAIQIALPRGVRPPKSEEPKIQVFTMSEASYTAGIETHKTEAGELRVYGVAKTVADCFKYRNRVGLDVAIEALKDSIASGKASPADIIKYAETNRVASVVQPYLMGAL